MNAVNADLLVVTGSYGKIRSRVQSVFEEGGLWGRSDLIACEGIGLALSDPHHVLHGTFLQQIETSLRLHGPDDIVFVGPTDYGHCLTTGETRTHAQEMEILWEARKQVGQALGLENLKKTPIVFSTAVPQEKTNDGSEQELVIGCIDPRYVGRIMRLRERRDRHVCALAGATGAVKNDATFRAIKETIIPLLPHLRVLVLRPHRDCGAFGGERNDPQGHWERHKHEARSAAQKLQEAFPDLDVRCRFLRTPVLARA